MSDSEKVDKQQESGKTEVCSFIKPRKQRGNVRKRTRDDDDEDDSTTVVKKDKDLPKDSPFFQTTQKPKEKETTKFAYEARRDVLRSGSTDQHATAVLETETSHDRDARAIFEKYQKMDESVQKTESGEKIYKGLKAYEMTTADRSASYSTGAGGASKGPMRAPVNVRSTCRFDYQPDVCKDYKETGYCGYGDSCKFAHMREDYKSGWQMEREWDDEQKRQKEEKMKRMMGLLEGQEEEEESKPEDSLPFACFICRGPFKEPVVTKCQHYFCEKCALTHYKKSSKCIVCGTQTQGIFNTAHEIVKKMRADGLLETPSASKPKKFEAVKKEEGESDSEEGEDEKSAGGVEIVFGNAPQRNEEEEALRELKEASKKPKFESSAGWAFPSDFSDSRKGSTTLL